MWESCNLKGNLCNAFLGKPSHLCKKFIIQKNETMTKAELVTNISSHTGLEEPAVLKMLEALMKIIRESLVEGENVYLRGFGSFILKRRAKKTGRNISLNTFVSIPEHYIPAFKPVKTFVTKVKIKRGIVTTGSDQLTKLKSNAIPRSSYNGSVNNISPPEVRGNIWNDIRGIGKKIFYPR